MGWWVADFARNGQFIELISWVFWVLASITLHELAHGWAAIWQGDDTPIRLDRMTGNPIVHMGPYSLLMFALCGIAWGLMPVNPSRFRDGRRGDVYVAAAGPLMNLVLAAFCLVVLVLWLKLGPTSNDFGRNIVVFLYFGLALNLILAPFNLLPIPPLDGSRILAGLSRRCEEWFSHPQAPIIGLFIFILVFFVSPIGDWLFAMGWMGAILLVELVGAPLGNPSLADVL